MKTIERLREDWLLATEINKLESRLWRMVRRDNLKTVLFTSAVRGEGKSTTVAYLATYLGMYPDRRILAMDFDFRIPTLNNHFGIVDHPGFDQVLAGELPVKDAVIKTSLPSLHLTLPSEHGADPNLLLHSRELRAAMAALREDYDLVLIDCPALIPVADTTMLLPLADGVVLVAMAGKTTGPQLKRVNEICMGMDANMLGLVVGNVEEAAPEYVGDDYNYGYGHAAPIKMSDPTLAPAARAKRKSSKGK